MVLYLLHITNRLNKLCFRLQNNGSYLRKPFDAPFSPDDFGTTNADRIRYMASNDSLVEVDGAVYRAGPTQYFLSETNLLFYKFRMLRREFPKMPELEQLLYEFRAADPEEYNTPILDFKGNYDMVQSPPFDNTKGHPSLVVYHALLTPSAREVGRNADEDFVRDIHRDSLHFWKINLTTGRTNIQNIETGADSPIEVLERGIEALRESWKPQY